MRIGRDMRNRGPYLAVFDIGATSVGVGISHSADGVTTVLWSSRTEYSYQAYDEYTRYERVMYSTLLEAGMKLMNEGVRAVRTTRPDFNAEHMQVACVLESPWFWGAVGRAETVKEKPLLITADELKGLEEQAYQEVLTVSEGRSWHEVVGESEILEREQQELKLNGYVVQSVERDHIISAGVSVYFAFIGITVRKQIEQILDRVIPHHPARLVTSTRLLASYYHTTVGVGSGNQSFLLEVEGRITSVASIVHGALARISTLPVGTNHILRAAAPDALSTEEARGKLLVAYKASKTDLSAALPEPVTEACDVWRDAVLAEFVRHSAGVVPAEHVLLMVGKRWNQILIPVLKKPWLMPGIRKERILTVTPFLEFIAQPTPAGQSGPTDRGNPSDSRLHLFTHALFYSAKN